jgi:high-affinity iron transporter
MVLAVFTALALHVPTFAQTPALAETPGVEAARRVAATLHLAAQEYRLAWVGGALTNTGEWDEAKLFVAEARRSAAQLPGAVRAEIMPRLIGIEQRLAARMPPESLAIAARDVELRLSTLLRVSLDDRPAREPSIDNGALLYRSTCQRCHGAEGHGDGPVTRAEHITPPPANLADPAALAGTTPLDLYRKISLGVPGTRMKAFGEALSREERWDLVAYALTFTDPAARGGRSGQLAVVFGTVRGSLGGVLDLAERGETDAASSRVLDAYMAFETLESSLGATDPSLVRRAEERFGRLRAAIAGGEARTVLERHQADLLASLAESERALTARHSAAGLFAESLLLMLREGFEAMLVVGAIMAVLVKAEAKEKQKHVRWGVVAAIAASLVTAAALELIFRVTASQREALEGAIMLVAAVMLFYASYWLISKVEIAAWTRFVKERIQRAAERGSALALAGVAFLAVYREGFETVLFYKALYVTGGGDGAAAITAGIVAGLAGLALVFVGIERFGLRVPMRPFFAVTGMTLAFMAFVFAGDGIKALQEGGYLGSTPLAWAPRSDFFGVYPTLESLGLQAAILLAILFGLAWAFVIAPRLATASAGGRAIARRNRKTQPRKSAGV